MSVTSPENTEVEELRSAVAALRAELDAVRSPRISILSEPLTYNARLVRDPSAPRGFRAISTRGNYSYIQDLAMAARHGDVSSQDRLDRHSREMRALAEAREQLFHPSVEYEFEQRAVNWTNGTGGYFAPPLWIIEEFAYQPTPERVLSKLAPQFELPEGAQSVNLPAWSAGADVGETQVGAAVPSQDPLDIAVSSAVATFAGNFDVPMQMLEQSPQGAHLDWMAFSSMEARYGYKLELQLFAGLGVASPQGSGNNQLLGIYNNTAIPAANVISFANSGVSAETQPTGATALFPTIGLMLAKIGQSRLLPPENVMMSTSRMAWMGSSEDLQNRPLMIANSDGSGSWDLIAVNVKVNDAIPRTSGVGGNEDRIVALRPSDWLILESDRRTQVMTEVLSGTLTARIQMRRYAAALLRRPESVAYLSGPGMATGGGF